MRGMIALGLAMALASPALAQQTAAPAPSCAAMDASLPAGFTDWNGKAALKTATAAEHLGHVGVVALGKGYEASLLNTPKVTFPVQPEKPGGSVAFAGLFTFTVETEGAYTVALSTPPWIDLLEDGKAISPTSFGHGPECTSIRKMVVFPLKAGTHTLQVSGNGAATMKLLVAKKP